MLQLGRCTHFGWKDFPDSSCGFLGVITEDIDKDDKTVFFLCTYYGLSMWYSSTMASQAMPTRGLKMVAKLQFQPKVCVSQLQVLCMLYEVQ
jgi:hypothetical protein